MVSSSGKERIDEESDMKSKYNARESVIEGSTIAKNTREQIEKKTGKKIVTSKNNKNIKQIKD